MTDKTYINPSKSVFSSLIPLLLKEHHLMRAKQVLAINQNAGRFSKDDYDTFIGPGGGRTGNADNPNSPVKPPNTTRRDLNTVQAKYLPFPGRIYFVSGETIGDLAGALETFLRIFNGTAPRSRYDGKKKNHPFRYRTSLEVHMNGAPSNPVAVTSALKNMQETAKEIIIDIYNIAPHASTIEARTPTMYTTAQKVNAFYGPGVTVIYDYVNSDRLGYAYGPGTGGPMRGGQVYALPRVRLAVRAAGLGLGASNLQFTRPGVNARRRTRQRNAARGRG
jgi:hypothetical protein